MIKSVPQRNRFLIAANYETPSISGCPYRNYRYANSNCNVAIRDFLQGNIDMLKINCAHQYMDNPSRNANFGNEKKKSFIHE